MRSLEGGWALFTSHPVFGAGLGAFMESQIRISGPLVIHSTPLWLMAEMGLVGLVAFSWFGWRLAQEALTSRTAAGTALLLVTVGFCIMSGPHDLLTQRSVWFIAGALLAIPRTDL
jgi:O-antigen ligase